MATRFLELIDVVQIIQQDNSDEEEVDADHDDRPPEAVDVALGDAFAEEDAVVIVAVEADVAISAVGHGRIAIHIALYAIFDFSGCAIWHFSIFI